MTTASTDQQEFMIRKWLNHLCSGGRAIRAAELRWALGDTWANDVICEGNRARSYRREQNWHFPTNYPMTTAQEAFWSGIRVPYFQAVKASQKMTSQRAVKKRREAHERLAYVMPPLWEAMTPIERELFQDAQGPGDRPDDPMSPVKVFRRAKERDFLHPQWVRDAPRHQQIAALEKLLGTESGTLCNPGPGETVTA